MPGALSWRTAVFRCDEPAVQNCTKWIFNLKVTNCVASNRILKPLLAGRNWHVKERRLCNFYSSAATSQLWSRKFGRAHEVVVAVARNDRLLSRPRFRDGREKDRSDLVLFLFLC